MMKRKKVTGLAVVVAISVMASGCGYDRNPPILVAVSDTVGISVSGGTSDQGADLTLGFKGRKIAVVPVSLTDSVGNQSTIAIPTGSSGGYQSHSVLATLAVDGAAVTPGVALEQVVAIGPAAEKWATGRAGQKPPWTE